MLLASQVLRVHLEKEVLEDKMVFPDQLVWMDRPVSLEGMEFLGLLVCL